MQRFLLDLDCGGVGVTLLSLLLTLSLSPWAWEVGYSSLVSGLRGLPERVCMEDGREQEIDFQLRFPQTPHIQLGRRCRF